MRVSRSWEFLVGISPEEGYIGKFYRWQFVVEALTQGSHKYIPNLTYRLRVLTNAQFKYLALNQAELYLIPYHSFYFGLWVCK